MQLPGRCRGLLGISGQSSRGGSESGQIGSCSRWPLLDSSEMKKCLLTQNGPNSKSTARNLAKPGKIPPIKFSSSAILLLKLHKSVMVGLSLGEQNFIKGGIAQDLRTDGRKRLTYRPISVETGVIPQASGSARVKLGATDVIASVKAELGKPSASHPDKGKVSIYVDCSPTAEPTFEVGRHYIVDATTEEESQMSSAISVSINRQGRICGLTKRGGAGLDPSVILDMISVAKHPRPVMMRMMTWSLKG
ncbi:exosome complex component RRP42, partial [Striga asiatica]